MQAIDYILIGIVLAVTVGISVYLWKRKKAGKNGCGCGCQGCPSAGRCHKTEENDGEV